MSECKYGCMDGCMEVRIYVYMTVYSYVCMHTTMHVRVYVCMHVFVVTKCLASSIMTSTSPSIMFTSISGFLFLWLKKMSKSPSHIWHAVYGTCKRENSICRSTFESACLLNRKTLFLAMCNPSRSSTNVEYTFELLTV